MVAALERDLGLSPVGAAARIAAEEAAGSAEARLRAELGDRFAGAWIDAETHELTIAVTDASAAAATRASGVLARVVARSEADLTAAKNLLDRAPAPPAVSAWYVDVIANEVVVQADPAARAAAGAFIRGSGADPALVRIEGATGRPVPQFTVYGGLGWGTGLSATCSTGFSVSRIAAPSVAGYVTAGHCGDQGETTFATGGGAWIPQGVIRGSTFPGRDYAWVEVTDEWTAYPLVRRQPGISQLVQGWQEAGIGATVCRSGIVTGWRCGDITAKNVTVNFDEGTVTGLTRTSACAADGDSGGPYLTGWHGQGVHVGSSGSCSSGGTAYFQPLVPILDAYDLRLMTVGTGNTPPVIRNMNCQYMGRFTMGCLVSQYHPDPVTIRWTVNGTPRSAWNDDLSVTGPCGEGGNSVRVTISNGSGSATASRSVQCTGQAP